LPFKARESLYLYLLLALFSSSHLGAQNIAITTLPLTLQELMKLDTFRNSIKQIHEKNSVTAIAELQESAENEEIGIPVGEEIILSLYLDKYYVADLFAYKSSENAQLSLFDLFELLDFPIEVNVNKGEVQGWFINEENKFAMMLPEQEGESADVVINGKQSSLAAEAYYIVDDEIFVDANSIADWFDFTLTFDFSTLNMQLISKTPLPLQMKLARESRKVGEVAQREAILPWRESAYQSVSSPLVDVQLYSEFDNRDEDIFSYSLLSLQDFAYLNSELYLNGTNRDALSNVRLKFSKEDSGANLLGPLHATEYKFGDITPVNTALSGTRDIGRGISFSNKSNNITNNRSKTFSGSIQPGWDIELYRNGILIEQALSSADGRYEFNDIPIFYGDNKFQLIFYGPQGQVRTESEDIYIDSNLLSEKQSRYAFSVTDNTQQLIELDETDSPYQPGWLSVLTYEQGLTDDFSVHAASEWLAATQGEDAMVYSLGANVTLFERLLLGADLQIDADDHKRASFLARTKLAEQALSFNFNRIDSFTWQAPESVISSDLYVLSMSGSIFENMLNYNNTATHINNNSTGRTANEFTNQLSFLTPFAYINNSLTWSQESVSTTSEQELYGSTRFQRHFDALSTQLLLSYTLKPDAELSYLEAEFALPLPHDIYSELTVGYQPNDGYYKGLFNLNFKLFEFDVQSSYSYDSDDNWELGLSTHFSFSYEPITEQVLFSERNISQNGLLMTRVFKDENANGVFDEGEELVAGVKVKALQHSRQAETDEDGIAVLNTLSNYKRTDIVVDESSIEEPFIVPATPGISLTPRKGFVEVVDIPLVNASELEGTVYIRDPQGKEKVGAYISIELRNAAGEIVAQTETEFDGYYLFTDLPPGTYSSIIALEDIQRNNLHASNALEFELSAAGDVVAGADFVMQKYTFVKGYVVTLGEFNSLMMLKTYWQIIKENYNNALQQQVFYSQGDESQLFQLNAAFFKLQPQAQRACHYLAEKNIDCNVTEFDFNL